MGNRLNEFPALLQNGKETINPTLTTIRRSSMNLGRLPDCWRHVTVIFLPKSDKSTDGPKAHRPISLSSFMLKDLDKLIDLYLKQDVLNTNPFHKLQKNKSCNTALHYVENSLEYKEIALGAFMDISGAFRNADHKSISKVLRKRICDPLVVNRINSMLLVTAELGSETTTITTTRSCPQGGVLSPLLFLVDELICKLSSLGYKTIC